VSALPTLTRPRRPSVSERVSRATGAEPVVPAAPTDPGGPAGPPAHRGVGLDTVFTALVALFGWVAGIARLSDNSFFWHLRTGEWILDHGSVPHHDIFSFTAPGTKWVAQSWLAELIYGALNRGLGAFGIRLFVGLIGVAVGVLAYRLALRLCRSTLRAFGISAVALACVFALWSERPLVLGLLFLLILLWVVEVPDSLVGRHPLVVIPVLMWLWVNVHGSFALGFAYLGLHLIGRWVDGAPPWAGRERLITIGAVIGFLASFVNPYGVSLVLFPIELLSRSEILSHVIEWQSPDFRSKWGIALALWICVFIAAVARGRHRVSRRDLIVTVPMLLLALWALRNIAVAPLIGLPVVARGFAVDTDAPERFSKTFLAAATAAIVLIGVMVGVSAAGESNFAVESYPVQSMRYVANHDLLGSRIFTDDADAGFVILAYSPEQRVFMDDRYDMYPTKLINDYFTVSDGLDGWSRALDRYDVDVVVWVRHSALSSHLDNSPSWERVHTDKTHAVWVRTG
jgi:hypothetical protein